LDRGIVANSSLQAQAACAVAAVPEWALFGIAGLRTLGWAARLRDN
jgi:hypothetical protein